MAERDPALLGGGPAPEGEADRADERPAPGRLPTDILDDAETTIRTREEVAQELGETVERERVPTRLEPPLPAPPHTPAPEILRSPPDARSPGSARADAPAKKSPAPIAPLRASTQEDRKPAARAPNTVYVVGFWRRLVAAMIDLAIILPVGLLLGWIATSVAGLSLPPSKLRGPDFWIDLVLDSDPVLLTGFAMIVVVAVVYLMVFQTLTGRTLGMRVLKMKVIDVWGERPSLARCAARTAGYLLDVATVMLGFLWVGFDSEKRGLHDWIAGTYVVKG